MPEVPPDAVTQFLQNWVQGDTQALRELLPIVYQELRRLASHHLLSERSDHTLQSTALVNEAFLRLQASQPLRLQNRGHFFAVASQIMRQILVDHARKRFAAKRDWGRRIDLDEIASLASDADGELVALDDALDALGRLDERQARVVEMKFFGGLSTPEIAEVLGLSRATIDRDWATARVWLHRHISRTP
jgi:RNA polymerase sigma factor (TIGR02999 family)